MHELPPRVLAADPGAVTGLAWTGSDKALHLAAVRARDLELVLPSPENIDTLIIESYIPAGPRNVMSALPLVICGWLAKWYGDAPDTGRAVLQPPAARRAWLKHAAVVARAGSSKHCIDALAHILAWQASQDAS